MKSCDIVTKNVRSFFNWLKMEWLGGSESDLLTARLSGTWKDSCGSLYHLELTGSDRIDVITRRPSGKILKTKGLIRIEGSEAYWGQKYRFIDHQYCGEWKAIGSQSFFWKKFQ